MKTPTLEQANRGEITALTRLTQRHPVAGAFFEVYIDGILAYDRTRDSRLDELMGPLAKEAEGGEKAEEPAEARQEDAKEESKDKGEDTSGDSDKADGGGRK